MRNKGTFLWYMRYFPYLFCICCLPRFVGKGHKQDSICPLLFAQNRVSNRFTLRCQMCLRISPRFELIILVCIPQVEQEVKVAKWTTSHPNLLSCLSFPPEYPRK